MPASMAPVLDIVFNDELDAADPNADVATLTLPTGSEYFLIGLVARGTNAGTAVTVASNGQTQINAATVGNATTFISCSSFDILTGTATVTVSGAGKITYCSLLLRTNDGRSIDIVVS